jgi:hypothetical protein
MGRMLRGLSVNRLSGKGNYRKGGTLRHFPMILLVALVLSLSPLPGGLRGAVGDASFFLTTYYWFPRTSGSVTVTGDTRNLGVDTRESLESSNFGGILKGENWRGHWGLAFDLLVMALGDESRFGGTRLDTTLDTSMTEVSVLWRLARGGSGEPSIHDPRSRGWVLDLKGGVRHTRADLEIDVDPGADASRSDNWVEPFGGGRVLYRPSRKWVLGLSMDAGGFGIGSASDLTLNLAGGADYRLGEEKWLQLGYRMMDIQYEDSRGQAGVNLRVVGPLAAVRLDF